MPLRSVRLRPRLGTVGAVSAALAAALVPAPALAAAPAYVALGDSYSSGTGTRSYLADGTSCQRSVYAYPSLLARSKGYALNFRACAGATTYDVATYQLGALGTGTAYVSLTVGGNDAGFAAVLTECAKPAWMSNCGAAVDRARSTIVERLPSRLSSLYSSVRRRAPLARVVVAGYPRVFNGVDCNAGTWFSATEMSRLNATADLLNTTIATAAGAAGLSYRDPTYAFTGHAVCDSTAWINGLSSPVGESYHPNRAGHSSGYLPLVGPRLTGTSVSALSGTLLEQAEASAEQLAAQQRAYASQDRAITPRRFVPPDLRSPSARTAAARAGVDLSSRASVATADRRAEARQEAARAGGGS